ncbi:MAG: GNAT family N-acetyltransferase [Clostridiales bacterium]|nr:GNAT family N-acetyltransferase [Clostridiales bacterium]
MDYSVRRYRETDAVQMERFGFWIGGLGAAEKRLMEPNVICLVCELDSELIGFICGENTAIYDNLLIAAEVLFEYRNQGVFRELFREYQKYAQGSITVFHNADTDEFYRKMGFRLGEKLHVSLMQN